MMNFPPMIPPATMRFLRVLMSEQWQMLLHCKKDLHVARQMEFGLLLRGPQLCRELQRKHW